MSGHEADDELRALGIKSTWGTEGSVMVELDDGTVRKATVHEELLHHQSVCEYHLEEFEAGCL